MTQVERLVEEDEAIKGIWCVPKYSNPTGATYSDDVVERLSKMKTKAADFRIFWDNAYSVHHLTDAPDRLKNILTCCKNAGNPERVYIFGSTSKISIAGAGISMMAGSEKNMAFTRKQLGVQTIGPDKLNQLRHVRFFRSMEHIETHMKKHAEIIVNTVFHSIIAALQRDDKIELRGFGSFRVRRRRSRQGRNPKTGDRVEDRVDRLRHRERAAFLELVLEVAAAGNLHGDHRGTFDRLGPENVEAVRMVDARGEAAFAEKPLPHLRRIELLPERFQGDAATGGELLGLVDRAHAAAPEQSQ